MVSPLQMAIFKSYFDIIKGWTWDCSAHLSFTEAHWDLGCTRFFLWIQRQHRRNKPQIPLGRAEPSRTNGVKIGVQLMWLQFLWISRLETAWTFELPNDEKFLSLSQFVPWLYSTVLSEAIFTGHETVVGKRPKKRTRNWGKIISNGYLKILIPSP